MEPLDYLNAVRRRWYLPVVLAVVAALAVLLTTDDGGGSEVDYMARSTLVPTGSSGREAEAQVGRLQYLIVSGDVPQRAANIVGGNARALSGRVRVVADDDLLLVVIEARHGSPDRAVAIADAFADATIEYLTERARDNYERRRESLLRELEASRQAVNELDARLAGLPEGAPGRWVIEAERDSAINTYRLDYEAFQILARQGGAAPGFEVLQRATAVPVSESKSAFSPPESRTARMLAAMAVAAVLGLGLALIADRLDTRLRDRLDFEEVYGAPVLAEVPAVTKRGRREFHPALDNQRRLSLHREAHRSLRTQLQLEMKEAPRVGAGAGGAEQRSVIAVTSALPREGKTTTVAALAASFAETGRSVLVLSADFRRPTIHRHLGVPSDGVGLTDVLAGHAELSDCVVPTAVEGVSLVPRGSLSGHPQNLLDHAGDLFAAARRLADVVLVDTAPVLVSSDTAEMVVQADIIVAVGRAHRTSRAAATRAAELLSTLNDLVGVVVVGIPADAVGRYAYYYAEDAARSTAVNGNGRAARTRRAHAPAHAGEGDVPAGSAVDEPVTTTLVAPTYVRVAGCTVTVRPDGAVVGDRGDGSPVTLSAAAADVWRALDVPAELDAVASQVAAVGGLEAVAASERAEQGVAELLHHGFLDRR